MDHTSSSITADRLIAANDAAWRFWRWHAAQPGEWTSAYLAHRGLRGLAAGLAPAGWSRLVPTLRRRGFTDDELVAAGLAVRVTNGAVGDAFRDRLVLPIRDDQDQIIGFTARRNPATDAGDEPPAKYINTTSTPVYDKSAALYGMGRTALAALARGACPVLSEGAFDAEAIHRAGTDLVPFALCGTALTATHLDQLRAAGPDVMARLILATDADEAGRRAVGRLWTLLSPEEAATVRVAQLADGADPADLVALGQRTALRASLLEHARPLIHALIDQTLDGYDLAHVEGCLAALRHIAAGLTGHATADTMVQASAHLQTRLGHRLEPASITHELVEASTSQDV